MLGKLYVIRVIYDKTQETIVIRPKLDTANISLYERNNGLKKSSVLFSITRRAYNQFQLRDFSIHMYNVLPGEYRAEGETCSIH